MRKHFYAFHMQVLNSFHYRFNTVLGLLFGNLSTLITLFFWNLVYEGDTQRVLNGFTLPGIFTYFVVGGIFRGFILGNSGFVNSDMIKGGSLGRILLKPYNPSISVYFQNLAGNMMGLLPQLLFLLCLLPFIGKYLIWNLSLLNASYVLLFLLISTISSHLLWSLLGYMAFWLEEANAVMWSFAVLLNLTTGMFIPLDFFPRWSIPVLEVLPFSSWGYIPTKIYLGLYEAEKQAFLLFIHLAWIAALLLINRLVWLKGIRQYTSVGG